MLSYEAIFFDEESVKLIHSLEKEQLPVINDEIHCTFRYHPKEDEIFDDIVGKEMEVYLIGYGFDGKNSGFELLIPDKIKKYYINYVSEESHELRLPHITASLAVGATPSKTRELLFEPLPEPVLIKGRFGYLIKDDTGEYISYEPYLKENNKSL